MDNFWGIDVHLRPGLSPQDEKFTGAPRQKTMETLVLQGTQVETSIPARLSNVILMKYVFAVIILGFAGCNSGDCGDLSTSSHSTLLLCSSDCAFTPPQTYQIVQENCVASVQGFQIDEISEDFECAGNLVIQGNSDDYFISSEQSCTGSNGTTCNITMAETEGSCP